MSTAEKVYLQLTGDDEGRVCRDIPEEACDAQPENFLKHVVALAATKTGDGLADAKLVLAWLMGALGAPSFLVALLVPVRESGALLPQLVTAASIRAMPLRKWAWAAGSLVQGLAVMGMGVVALTLEGAAAGWSLIALLALMALARSVCSVSHKDVLGKTVSKSTRGTATGTASTLSSALVLLFGLMLASGWLDLGVLTIALVLLVAGAMWLLAAGVFLTLAEKPGATEGGGNALSVVVEQFGLLKTDPQLRRFILTRALLMGTALAPPFLLALGGRSGSAQLGELGLFVIASSLAAVSSTYIWGRLSDVSSRRVLCYAGLLGAAPLIVAALTGMIYPQGLALPMLLPTLLFIVVMAHQGVRLGRATHVVDMADQDTRAAYTALSNTLIGLLLLAASAFGIVAEVLGEAFLLGVFAVMCLAAAAAALTLDEVQERD
ncbi:MAG: MFS transporter [Gammaproteobacteria bacterium]|nr:MFS transporter [Gammaproteobacteria bacterium]